MSSAPFEPSAAAAGLPTGPAQQPLPQNLYRGDTVSVNASRRDQESDSRPVAATRDPKPESIPSLSQAPGGADGDAQRLTLQMPVAGAEDAGSDSIEQKPEVLPVDSEASATLAPQAQQATEFVASIMLDALETPDSVPAENPQLPEFVSQPAAKASKAEADGSAQSLPHRERISEVNVADRVSTTAVTTAIADERGFETPQTAPTPATQSNVEPVEVTQQQKPPSHPSPQTGSVTPHIEAVHSTEVAADPATPHPEPQRPDTDERAAEIRAHALALQKEQQKALGEIAAETRSAVLQARSLPPEPVPYRGEIHAPAATIIEVPKTPEVKIGQVDVFVEAAQRPRSGMAPTRPAPALASRHYLRRL
jgi:hypothetical protein